MFKFSYRSAVLFLFFLFALPVVAFANEADRLLRQPGNPIAGNPHGKIAIVEFFDYQCSHCVAMSPVIASTIQAYPDVKIIYKDFPIRGAMSIYAAKAALAANVQGKYAAFNHALMSLNESLTEANVIATAQSVGLNIKRLKKDMQSKMIQHQLNENIQLANKLHIDGTPAFYIGKADEKNITNLQNVLGEMSSNELKDAINKFRK